jgi:mannose/fructose/N-acetylgalactosamine-specific phosphotransferase system component IIC
MMLLKALLCSLVAMFGLSDSKFFYCMFQRPIITASLTGLVLGDFQTGVIIGGTLELVWMGFMNIGASIPAEVVTGSVIGTAFGILSKGGVDLALVIAIPVALLGSYIKTVLYTFLSWFVHRADKFADNGDLNGVNRVHIITGWIIILSLGILTFVAILVGSDAMTSFIDSLPQNVIQGFSVANGMLVAVGFGMLLNVMSTKKLIPFYFLGFILAAYLKVDTMFVAILAAIIAIVRLYGKNDEAKGDFNV